MNFTDIFVRRPVLATVVSLMILVLGLRAMFSLPVLQYPRTENAIVTVTTTYYGADPDVVAGFITTPLENAIAQANGIDYMTSTSQSGVSTITANLRLNYDSDKALTEINTKVNSVLNQLPPQSQQPVLSVKVGQTIDAMYIGFGSDVLPSNNITDYLLRVVQPKLQAVEGVQTAEMIGNKNFALRAWLDPDKLAAYGLTAGDVSTALAKNDYISGLGNTKGQMVQVNLTASTSLHSLDEFRDLVIKQSGGAIVRLRDIANVSLGSEDYESQVGFDGKKAVYIGIQVAPSANLLQVIAGIRKVLPDIQAQLPQGLHGEVVYDSTKFVNSSIHEVITTLIEALFIVTLVVFAFLGSPRSVLIPVVAIPLSLIGAFMFMLAFGFSINLLTLLALVLAIGLVVDDAIIVVENVNRHIEEGMRPGSAALQAARELSGPIIAMTIVLIAVYVPIGFQGGLTGALFTEFAFTLVGAVTVSGVVALTLTPMLCSRMLKPHKADEHYAWKDVITTCVERLYQFLYGPERSWYVRYPLALSPLPMFVLLKIFAPSLTWLALIPWILIIFLGMLMDQGLNFVFYPLRRLWHWHTRHWLVGLVIPILAHVVAVTLVLMGWKLTGGFLDLLSLPLLPIELYFLLTLPVLVQLFLISIIRIVRPEHYQRYLHTALESIPVVVVFCAIILGSIYFLYGGAKSELAPQEDQGVVITISNAAPNATLAQKLLYSKQVFDIFAAYPEMDHVFQLDVPGQSISGLVLKPWDERKRTSNQLQPIMQQDVSKIAGVRMFAFQPPPLPGSNGLPVQFILESTQPFERLNEVAQAFLTEARKSGMFIVLDTDLKIDQPQSTVVIDRDKTAQLGLTMNDVGSSLASMLGGGYVNYFSLYGRSYKVIPQVDQRYRLNTQQLGNYYITTGSGASVALSTVAHIETKTVPESLNHFQQLNAATIQGVMFPGVTLGDALANLKSLSAKVLPQGYSIDYGGQSRQYAQESSGFIVTFIFALIIIFLTLSAQFESFLDPLIILVSVPMSIAGALIFISLGVGGSSLNIYTQVGLVTLMGLISKHGILIVEFANKEQEGGKSKRDAIELAASIRLRPILMTTAAMVLGVAPLIFASGAGAVSRFNMGLVISTGLTIGTLFTLFVVPAVYMLLAADHHKNKAAQGQEIA